MSLPVYVASIYDFPYVQDTRHTMMRKLIPMRFGQRDERKEGASLLIRTKPPQLMMPFRSSCFLFVASLLPASLHSALHALRTQFSILIADAASTYLLIESVIPYVYTLVPIPTIDSVIPNMQAARATYIAGLLLVCYHTVCVSIVLQCCCHTSTAKLKSFYTTTR